ncbi:hypothetical protein [Streptomyces sp. NPDC002394]
MPTRWPGRRTAVQTGASTSSEIRWSTDGFVAGRGEGLARCLHALQSEAGELPLLQGLRHGPRPIIGPAEAGE